jgi:large subunit ribosomal protein LP2
MLVLLTRLSKSQLLIFICSDLWLTVEAYLLKSLLKSTHSAFLLYSCRPFFSANILSQMRHIAAYLLLQIGGNASPSAADVKKVLGAVGIDCDESRLDTLISELEGKDINELIAEGSSKLASVSLCVGHVRFMTKSSRFLPAEEAEEAPLRLPLLPVVALLRLPPRKRRRRRRRR